MIGNNPTKIILAPCVSEKSTRVQIDRQYVFRVNNRSGKKDIVRAIKSLFGVDVESVRVCRVKGKKRIFRGIPGRTKDWKKAYVKVKEGQSIDLGRM